MANGYVMYKEKCIYISDKTSSVCKVVLHSEHQSASISGSVLGTTCLQVHPDRKNLVQLVHFGYTGSPMLK